MLSVNACLCPLLPSHLGSLPYTFTNCALVGRPASVKSRVPSAIFARAALLRVTDVAVGFVDRVADRLADRSDFLAAFISFTGFLAARVRSEL